MEDNNINTIGSSEYTTCQCGIPVYDTLPTNMRVPLLGKCHTPMVPTKWVYDLNQNKTQSEINNKFIESEAEINNKLIESEEKIDNAIKTLDNTVDSLNRELQNTLTEYGSHTTVYYMQPSISNARVSADGILYDKVVTCDVYKVVSDNNPTKMGKDAVTLTFSIGYNNSSWSTQDEYDWDNGIVLNSTWRTVRIFLYIGSNVDYNTTEYYTYIDIPLIKDGQFDTNFKLWVGDTNVTPNVDSEPWASWISDDEEAKHVGDYYVGSDFKYYKFIEVENGYSWQNITDTTLSTMIAQKSQIDSLKTQIASMNAQIVQLNNKIEEGGQSSSQYEPKEPVVILWKEDMMDQVYPISNSGITIEQLREASFGLRKVFINVENMQFFEITIISKSLFSKLYVNNQPISEALVDVPELEQIGSIEYIGCVGPSLYFAFGEQNYICLAG